MVKGYPRNKKTTFYACAYSIMLWVMMAMATGSGIGVASGTAGPVLAGPLFGP